MKKTTLSTVVVCVISLGLVVGCNTTPVQEGALVGGALGAGAGAIIGNQVDGQSGEGALIGGAAGALAGALIGDQVGKRQSVPQGSAPNSAGAQRGHYETRIVTTASGETYEERVWVPDN